MAWASGIPRRRGAMVVHRPIGMAAPVQIDGSAGEGGGQVLRTSLALSVLTGRPLAITKIRATRSPPGLRPQHLKAVQAAAMVSGGRVEGARLGAVEIFFVPRRVCGGRYRFEIGTAGATSLVFQTLFVPLSFADGPSQVTVAGGTHVPWSPCFEYLAMQWLPAVRGAGYRGSLRLESAGFYPRGGGAIRGDVLPAGELLPMNLMDPGTLQRIRGASVTCGLDTRIAIRQRLRAMERLENVNVPVDIELGSLHGRSPGSVLVLFAELSRTRLCAFALGARGKPAGRVADEAVDELLRALDSHAACDRYLADQLLLPLACVPAASHLSTAEVTPHLLTNAHVIRKFIPIEVHVSGEPGKPGEVWVIGTDVRAAPSA